MENEREKQWFWQEAERKARETAGIDDDKLMWAIRSGVRKGSASSGRRTKRYIGSGAAGLALAAGIFLAVDGQQMLHRAAVVEAPASERQPDLGGEWDEYEDFRASVSGEASLKAALDGGKVEALNQKIEKGLYDLRLHGVVRDSRKLTLLYSMGGPDIRKTALSRSRLLDSSGDVIGIQESRRDVYRDGRLYGYMTFDLEKTATSFNLQALLYERTLNPGYDEDSHELTALTDDVNLDSASAAVSEEELADGQTLTVDGQVLRIEQALITPQRGYVVLVPDANNDKVVSRLVGAKLTVRKNGQTTVSEGGLGVGVIEQAEDESPRFIFTFNKTALPQNPDSVIFSVEGIEALSAEERKLIVDTDAKKVLQAPEEGITAAVNPGANGTKQLQIGYPIDAEKFFGSDPPSMLFLDTVFTDAGGAEYPLTYPSDGSLFGEVLPTSKSALASFVFEDRNYAQPLTFTISAYPKEIMEYREIRLK